MEYYSKHRLEDKTFANNLRALLKRKKMTQTELALILKVRPQTVASWCNAEGYPRVERLKALCIILEVQEHNILWDDITL